MKEKVINKQKKQDKEKVAEKSKKREKGKVSIGITTKDLFDNDEEVYDDSQQEILEDRELKQNIEETELTDFDDEQDYFDIDESINDFDLETAISLKKTYKVKVSYINGERILSLDLKNLKNISQESLAWREDILFFIAEEIIKKNETLFKSSKDFYEKIKETDIKKISQIDIVDKMIKVKNINESKKENFKNYVSDLVQISFFDINGHIEGFKIFFERKNTMKMKRSAEKFVKKYKDILLGMEDKDIDKEIRRLYKKEGKKKLSEDKLSYIKELLNNDKCINS